MNIKKNQTGGYTVIVEIGQYTGKLRQQKRITAKTKKEVKEKYLKLINELEQKNNLIYDDITFGNYVEKYLTFKSFSVVESTLSTMKIVIKAYLLPVLHSIQIREIDFRVLQKVLSFLVEKKLAHSSIRNILNRLSDILNLARKEKIILENPVKDLELPKRVKSKINVWSEEDISRFLSFRNDPKRGQNYLPILIALLTGMRKSEIMALTWDKIDLEDSTITVEQIIDQSTRELVLRTKNKHSRKIAFDSLLKEELIKYKSNFENKNKDNLIFHTKAGLVLQGAELNRCLNQCCRKMDLPRIKFHETRHTHATLCIHSGVNIKQLQERLGHANASMTLDVYGHFFPSQQKQIVKKIEEKFMLY